MKKSIIENLKLIDLNINYDIKEVLLDSNNEKKCADYLIYERKSLDKCKSINEIDIIFERLYESVWTMHYCNMFNLVKTHKLINIISKYKIDANKITIDSRKEN